MQNPSGIALTSALRNLGPVVAGQTASLSVRVDSTANKSTGTFGASGAAAELVEVVRLAVSVVQKYADAKTSAAEAQEKAESAKVFGIIAAVVLVVVAVVIAAFTFGAGAALVAAAVVAAAAIIGAAAAVANAAAAVNHPLAQNLLALLAKALTAVKLFERESAFDAEAARRRALAKIMEALRSLEALAPPVNKLTGPCLADPGAALSSAQQANKALENVIACLRRRNNSEWLIAIAELERLKAMVAQALAKTRLKTGPTIPMTPSAPGPVPIPYPNTTSTTRR
jgi:hypothetical protein